MNNHVTFNDLEESIVYLNTLKYKNLSSEKGWPAYKVFKHCEMSIDYSMKGFPKYKSNLFQKTIGKLASVKYLKQGYFTHNLTDEIPGAPFIHEKGNYKKSLQSLIDKINEFKNYSGDLFPHFAFGKLSKEEFSRIHAMHISDHLKAFNIDK